MFRPFSHTKAFTLIELIVVIVILAILALLAIPTFSKVVDRSNDASTLATLNSAAKEVQVLRSFDQSPWSEDHMHELSKDLTLAFATTYASGTYAAAVNKVVKDAGANPEAGQITYLINGQGLALAMLSKSGKVCIVGLNYATVQPGYCSVPSTTESSHLEEQVSNSDTLFPEGTTLSEEVIELPDIEEPEVAIAPVTDLTAAPKDRGIDLVWVAPPGTVTNYKITVTPSVGGTTEFTTTVPTFSINNLNTDTSYTFVVVAQRGTTVSTGTTVSASTLNSITTQVTTGTNGPFSNPGTSVALNGYLYIADQSNNAVKVVNLSSGARTTLFAGVTNPIRVATDGTFIFVQAAGGAALKLDIPASKTSARSLTFRRSVTPQLIVSVDNILYIKDSQGLFEVSATGTNVKKLPDPTGVMHGMTILGDKIFYTTDGGVRSLNMTTGEDIPLTLSALTSGGTTDGMPGVATWLRPQQITTDGAYLYVASGAGDYKIRRVDVVTGETTTVAKTSASGRTSVVYEGFVYHTSGTDTHLYKTPTNPS